MCLFNNCISRTHGGVCAIAKDIYLNEMGPKNDKTQSLDSQYNCYQNCFLRNNRGYGSTLLVSAINLSIIYSTTSNSYNNDYDIETLSWGANYDLSGDFLNTKYVNCTGGNSYYCGGIEYRYNKIGKFMFNTLSKIKGKYILAFQVDYIENNISYCNIFNNIICDRQYDDYPSAFVFYQVGDIKIQSFFFCKNSFEENGRIAFYLFLNPWNITLINCYGLFDDEYQYDFDYIHLIDCHFDNITLQTIALDHINTGNCQTQLANIVSTPFFTESSKMTSSDYFSSSLQFTKSGTFTQSSIFTPSYNFNQTSPFTPSHTFTQSNKFSESNFFIPSNDFSNSIFFSGSNKFTHSIYFDESKIFS